MNKLFVLVFFVSCSSLEDHDWEMDSYVGMTFSQVTELLGKPKSVEKKIIYNIYSRAPVEPPYPKFFSEEEQEQGIEITIARWVPKWNTEVLVWLKSVDDDLIVFTSTKQRIKRSNLFIKYL
jgi:hypothetical protein